VLEQVFIVDYRFLFPFVSDLTFYRPGCGSSTSLSAARLSADGLLPSRPAAAASQEDLARDPAGVVSCQPAGPRHALIMVLLIQYVPLLTRDLIPFVGQGWGPGQFTMSLFHIIGVLIMVIPLSTWFFQLTGRPYLGAFVTAAIVTWMFVSSQ